jgi:hypothetical protein
MSGRAETVLQVPDCRKTSENGSLLQIHGKTITLLVDLNTVGQQPGLPKEAYSQNGSHLDQTLSYGFMENVRVPL